ncbi:MAG: xanthine dehydrogenase family protein molybdopterin-binding subunit, partial [Bacteroidales bacterium]
MKKNTDTGIEQQELNKPAGMKRRNFIKLLGGGIFVFFYVGDPLKLLAQRQRLPEDFNAFLRVNEDGMVSCFTGKVELGQGVITSLAQMLADELEVAYEKVDMVMGDTDLCPWDMGTFGSMTTRFFGPPLRAAAAEARATLLKLGSGYLNMPEDRLKISEGTVLDKTNPEKMVTYSQLTKGKKIEKLLTEAPPLEEYTRFTVSGQPKLRRDSGVKVTGEAKFAGDIRLPGMVYAKILRPPSHGAKLTGIDTSGIHEEDGIELVQDGDLVAVLHESPEMAEIALSKINATWEIDRMEVNDRTIFHHFLNIAPEPSVAAESGDLSTGAEISHRIIEQEYLNSYVSHAPIEPHAAVAVMEGGRIRVWASTQTPFPLKDDIAEALDIPGDKVRVTPPFVGGGFGGKTNNRQAIEAARLAKLTGKPVMVVWNRKEEFFYDTFRPAAVVKIKSGVTESGKISLWDNSVYFAGSRGSEHQYDIPHHRTRIFNRSWTAPPGVHPFATGPWRAPSNNTNTHARESQIDIMASEAGIDPLEFRLNNLKDEKMIGVL